MNGGKKSRKSKQKNSRKSKMNKSYKKNVTFYRFIRSNIAPKRLNILRGGGGDSATFSNSNIAASPQSYLPYNNFANDPGYSVVNARNTGPFLTGVSSGGKKGIKSRSAKKHKKRMTRIILGGGGDAVTTGLSNGLNTATNGMGIMNVPAINEISGVAGVVSGFSNTGSLYNSTNYRTTPLA